MRTALHRAGLTLGLAAASLALLTACGPRQCETVEPDEAASASLVDWVPDESLETIEQAKLHEADPPEVDPYAELSEEQRTDKARVLFGEAEELAAQAQWLEAKNKYEEAYHLVPSKHGLAYKIANAAIEVGDCEKAQIFLEHYLIYADLERHEALLHSALTKHRQLECAHP